MFTWGLESIKTSGADIVPIELASVLVIIGPNGSGKSTALREILNVLQGGNEPRRVVSEIVPHRDGTPQEFEDWLAGHYPVRSINGTPHVYTRGGAIPLSNARPIWDNGPLMSGAHLFLTHLLDTTTRLAVSTYTNSIDVWTSPPQTYIHVLQTNDELAKKVSNEVRAAFGFDLVIDWTAGAQVGFRVGTEPARTVASDRVSQEYAENLRLLPQLDQEGDGVRSFVGSVLAAYCGSHPVLLIDEPEAFLHPPQARRLGSALAKSVGGGRQVIVATHSSDVVQGAVDGSSSVAVLRLTRNAGLNRASLLPSADLNALWSKPQMRSAAAVDGLFSNGVVICEADSDARFYETLVQRFDTSGKVDRAPDLYFVAAGGKGGIATLASAYHRMGTPTAVIADLDLLRNEKELEAVLASVGGDIGSEVGPYRSLLSELRALPPTLKVDDFVAAVRRELSKIKAAGSLSSASKRELNNLVENAADWSSGKRNGITTIRGGARSQAESLLERWRQLGLFLVPLGELESWWQAGPASKSDWIAAAIPEASIPGTMPAATEFIARLLAFFGISGAA